MEMLHSGAAKRLIITVNGADTWHGKQLHMALIELLHRKGLISATVVRAVAGFTGLATEIPSEVLDAPGPPPVRVEVVDRAELIDAVLPAVEEMVTRGLIELQDTNVVKWWAEAQDPPRPSAVRRIDPRLGGKAREAHVYVRAGELLGNQPLHAAVIERARALGIARITLHDGLPSRTVPKGRDGPTRSDERSILISIVDREERVDEFLVGLQTILTEGCFVTVHDVTVLQKASAGTSRSGPRLSAG
jgi:PII-like signaling protein